MPRYECDCCGACCRQLIVEGDLLDFLREPRIAEADAYYSGKSQDEITEELHDPGKCILLAATRPCLFLDDDNHCSIHPTRPNCCVAMLAGDEQCQQAREAAGLPPLEPVEEVPA